MSSRASTNERAVRYYLGKRMLKEAEPLIEESLVKNPSWAPIEKAYCGLYRVSTGKPRRTFPESSRKFRQTRLPILTYDLACIYALAGKGGEALKWLRKTANEGVACYLRFARDSFLDPIRKDSPVIQFMTEMKLRLGMLSARVRVKPVARSPTVLPNALVSPDTIISVCPELECDKRLGVQ